MVTIIKTDVLSEDHRSSFADSVSGQNEYNMILRYCSIQIIKKHCSSYNFGKSKYRFLGTVKISVIANITHGDPTYQKSYK